MGAGLSDAQETIMAAPWLEPMPPELGARTSTFARRSDRGYLKNRLNKGRWEL